MEEPWLHIALMHPEIPGNTGNIGRLAVGVGARLHLIRPLGFRTDDKAVRRAGIDHWRHVDVVEHADAEAFWRWVDGRTVHLVSARGDRPYTACPFAAGDVVVFGCESTGLPHDLVAERGAWRIPMTPRFRSLNLANAAAVVVYEAVRRIAPPHVG